MSESISSYLKTIESIGFRKVLDIPFVVENYMGGDEKHKGDVFYVFFHEQYGILLEFDTYSGWGKKNLNGGYLHYEWEPCIPIKDVWPLVSSGGFETIDGKTVWVGHADCRDNIESHISSLAKHGKFITPWIHKSNAFRPKFVHWGDHHCLDNTEGFNMYQRACSVQGRQRYLMLPDNVRAAIEIAYRGAWS